MSQALPTPATPELPADAGAAGMPSGLDRHTVRRRLLQIAALVVLVAAVVMLVPGLVDIRERLSNASPAELVLAAGLEVLSCLAYVVAFRAAFCPRMTWWMSYRIGMSSLGAASVLPVGGVGGLTFGAWALRRGGLPLDRVARRTVAFFVITSAINVAAVIGVGVGVGIGILPGTGSLALTLVPVGLAAIAIVLTLAVPHLAARLVGRWSAGDRPKLLRKAARVLDAAGDGVGEAVALLRSRDVRLLAGAIGYLVFDLAVFWASFRAVGASVELSGLLLAYLLGQLGALIPIPGGIGGTEAGLVGALVLYGNPLATATVSVLIYRTLLLAIPATLGGIAFGWLKRSLRDEHDARIPCADDYPQGTMNSQEDVR